MNIQQWIVFISTLLPIVVMVLKLVGYLGRKSQNLVIKNLSERALVVVRAMERSNLTNEDKKTAAMQKLAEYASEVGIKVTAQQVDDYIESAVTFIKLLKP